MIPRILLFIYILLLSVTTSSAQERAYVSGKVIDVQSNHGIPFCTVLLKDLKKGGYTDDET